MKVKTSLTLSEDVLRGVDQRAEGNRSAWIERVLRQHLRKLDRDETGRHDMEVYKRHAEWFRSEFDDVLKDQISLDDLDIDHDAATLEASGGVDAAR